MLLRIPFMLLLLFFCQSAQAASWREDLGEIDAKRNVLFKELQPGFVIRPLSEQSAAIVGGHSKHGIDYERVATLEEREMAYKSMMRTAVMHSRTHFFEQNYALTPVTDERYYGHLTACYFVDTATQMLEGPNGITTVSALAQNLNTYFQRMLNYKDTALRMLVDETVATKVLGVLGRYTQSDYQTLLTDKFVAWYQDVTASYPQDRAKYGIKMDVLPPLPSEEQVLDISFSDGLVATYGASGLSFRCSVSSQGDVRSTTREIVYRGLYINRALPMKTLQITLQRAPGVSRVGLRSEKVGLETQYDRVIPPLAEQLNQSSSLDQPQLIGACEAALSISDNYRVFGGQKAANNVFAIEKRFGVTQYNIAMKTEKLHERKFINALDLLEPAIRSEKSQPEQKDKETLAVVLNGYGFCLNKFIINETDLSFDVSCPILIKASNLFKEAIKYGFSTAEQNLVWAENRHGVLLVNAAQSLGADLQEGKSDLWSKGLALLEHANALHSREFEKEVSENLAATVNLYGIFLLKRSYTLASVEQVISMRRRAKALFERALDLGVQVAAENLIEAQKALDFVEQAKPGAEK